MVFLDKIDTAPLQATDFNFEFYSWISALIDTLNETFQQLEDLFNNGIQLPQYTNAQIIDLAASSPDGTMWYSTDETPPNSVVVKVNGTLVKLVAASFP